MLSVRWCGCRITFESANVRAHATSGGASATEARAAEPVKVGIGIGGSFVPSHLDHQKPRTNFSRPLSTRCGQHEEECEQ